MDALGRPRFDHLVARLPDLLEELRASLPLGGIERPIPKRGGVYVLSEGMVPLYVGQTRNLQRRVRQHGGPKARENQAVFAFKLARLEGARTGLVMAGVTRREIARDPRFEELFSTARARVAAMEVRFVEIDDPELRTVFEVYAAVVLGTLEHNSFETH